MTERGSSRRGSANHLVLGNVLLSLNPSHHEAWTNISRNPRKCQPASLQLQTSLSADLLTCSTFTWMITRAHGEEACFRDLYFYQEAYSYFFLISRCAQHSKAWTTETTLRMPETPVAPRTSLSSRQAAQEHVCLHPPRCSEGHRERFSC